MQYVQFLILELTPECPLGAKHTWCPNTHPDRFKRGGHPLTEDKAIDIAVEAYTEHGFTGMVGFHYYNEPMAGFDKIKRVMSGILEAVPQARFVLWSNGLCIPHDLQEYGIFDQLNFTDYGNKEKLNEIAAAVPNVKIWGKCVDNRMTEKRVKVGGACFRVFVEFIVDFMGWVHLCCYDWRGKAAVANVHDMPFSEIVKKWQNIRNALVHHTGVHHTAPGYCRQCWWKKEFLPSFVPDVHRRISADLQHIRTLVLPDGVSSASGTPVVVAVAYRIPQHRVTNFLEWNRELFAKSTVVLVVEDNYDIPDDYPTTVAQLKYDEPMEMFSLTRTKNAGLALASRLAPDSVIICTDIDIVFPANTWRLLTGVAQGTAGVPLYLMAHSYAERDSKYDPAPKATGTIAMLAEDWENIRYDERCQGYGSDDAILLQDLHAAGIFVDRFNNEPVYHIAHIENTCQREFKGRTDHWNRDTGFNKENFGHNGQFYRNRRKR